MGTNTDLAALHHLLQAAKQRRGYSYERLARAATICARQSSRHASAADQPISRQAVRRLFLTPTLSAKCPRRRAIIYGVVTALDVDPGEVARLLCGL